MTYVYSSISTCHGCGLSISKLAISITKEATDTLRNDHAQIPRLAPGLNVADPRVSLEIAQAMAGTWICPKKYLRGEAIESVGLSLQIFILTKTI